MNARLASVGALLLLLLGAALYWTDTRGTPAKVELAGSLHPTDARSSPSLPGTSAGEERTVAGGAERAAAHSDPELDGRTIRVVDRLSGQPVREASVEVLAPGTTSSGAQRTDSRGIARVLRSPRGDSSRLRVAKDDYFGRIVSLAATDPAEVVVELHPCGSLRLRLVDGNGGPLPDIDIQYSLDATSIAGLGAEELRALEVCQTFGTTDVDGRCARGALPRAAKLILWFDGVNRSLELPSDAENTDHTFVLDTPGAVEGRVVSDAGAPLAGELVVLSSLARRFDDRALRTTTEGRFRFERLSGGSARLECGESPSRSRTVLIPDEGLVSLPDIVLPASAELRGRLVGVPARISPSTLSTVLSQDGERVDTRQPNADGTFSLHGIAGPAVLTVKLGSGGQDLARLTVDLPAAGLDVELSPRLRELVVRLEGAAEGQPVDAAVFDPRQRPRTGRPVPLASWSGIALKGDVLVLPLSSTDPVDLEVRTAPTRGARLRSVAGNSGVGDPGAQVLTARVGTARLAIEAQGAAAATSSPIPGDLELIAERWSGRDARPANDCLEPIDVCPGSAWISVAQPGSSARWAARVELEVDETRVIAGLDEAGATLRGRVAGPLNADLGREATLSWISGMGYARQPLDSAGSFAFTNLAEGRYVVAVRNVGKVVVDLQAGQELAVVLDVPELQLVSLVRAGHSVDEILSAEVWRMDSNDPAWRAHAVGRSHPSRSKVYLPSFEGRCLVRFEFVDGHQVREAMLLVEGGDLRDGSVLVLGANRITRGDTSIAASSRPPDLRVLSIDGVELGTILPHRVRAIRARGGWAYEDIPDECLIALPGRDPEGGWGELQVAYGDTVLK